MHLNLATSDLDASVAFHRTLLLAEPAKHYSDYALFLSEQPGLELALDLDSHTDVREGAHDGVVVEKPEEVDAAITRLRAAGYAVDVELDETCCYAVANKVRTTDPDGRRWEAYFVVADAEDATTTRRRAAARTGLWHHPRAAARTSMKSCSLLRRAGDERGSHVA